MNVAVTERIRVPIEALTVEAYAIPTDGPEADGTLAWDSTTIVVVHAHARAGAETVAGIGYSYTDAAAADLIERVLAPIVTEMDALSPQRAWAAMATIVRNLGRPGLVSMAMAAVDLALWDLKARLLEVPLSVLLGAVRDRVPVYGSGGFTSYTDVELSTQLSGWVADGIGMVKMKVGSNPEADPERVRVARAAVGPNVTLMVDANGAYDRKQALALAERFAAEANVSWFEEPVSSDDLEGLALLRDRGPAGMQIAAGEYAFDLDAFRRLLSSGAVDVLQADVTRCGGITGLAGVAGLCAAHHVGLSLHCAPAAHLHPALALEPLVHLEYFHDHVRIERLLFGGVSEQRDGLLAPDAIAPGNGLSLRPEEAERYAV